MGVWMRIAPGLAALAVSTSAAAQNEGAGTAGTYIVERMETASALELAPDGRFRWGFSYGALDLTAEGRWRRDGDAVVLDTEPSVATPRFELVGTDAGRGPLTVRIEDADGEMPHYLDAVAEYAVGEGTPGSREGDAFAFEPSGRRIVAVRLGSRAFGFVSAPFPVPAGIRRMRFRFFPNDLGRVDFRDTRAMIGDDALMLPVLGEALRYRRLSAQELVASQSTIEDPGTDSALTETGDPDWSMCVNQDGQAPTAQADLTRAAALDANIAATYARHGMQP